MAFQNCRNGLCLDGSGGFVALFEYGFQDGRGQFQFFKVHGKALLSERMGPTRLARRPPSQGRQCLQVSGATHKLKRRLESAPAEVLMLRQLAAATGRIVARIEGAGIIPVLLLCFPKEHTPWPSTFSP